MDIVISGWAKIGFAIIRGHVLLPQFEQETTSGRRFLFFADTGSVIVLHEEWSNIPLCTAHDLWFNGNPRRINAALNA